LLLSTFLERNAARYPDKTALVCGNWRWTYGELEAQSNRFANALIAAGLERRDRVAICLENSAEAVISIFAILKAGGVFLGIHPSTKPEKLAYVLNDCRARALVTTAATLDALRASAVPTPHLVTAYVADQVVSEAAGPTSAPEQTCIDMDLAALIYTSGSTGKPKGVMLTHFNMVAATESVTSYLENSPGDVILNVLPLSFTYGLSQLLTTFLVGATLVLERSFAYPQAVLETMRREKVSGFALVPTMAAILLQADPRRLQLPALRYITNAAAALSVAQIRKLREFFPQVKIYSMYGLTECQRVSYLPPEQLDVRPGSVGKAIPNEEVYLADENGRRMGPGETGELIVRGSNVMRGYWGLPEETDRVLRPGPFPGEKVLCTGDLFRMDEEGYLYFVGRKDDVIKTKGEKVSPREVEEVLYGLEAVAEAVVIGVPDEILGQAVKAIITLRNGEGMTAADVQKHCARRLEDFMVPKFVEFRETLPRSPNGKIAKLELALQAAGGR
jgi:long-chain acyl-CoA synthetase